MRAGDGLEEGIRSEGMNGKGGEVGKSEKLQIAEYICAGFFTRYRILEFRW